jgi:DNA-binding MarR family transcriptional regulator
MRRLPELLMVPKKESEIAEALATDRMRVRPILKRLVEDGLVMRRPNGRGFVATGTMLFPEVASRMPNPA